MVRADIKLDRKFTQDSGAFSLGPSSLVLEDTFTATDGTRLNLYNSPDHTGSWMNSGHLYEIWGGNVKNIYTGFATMDCWLNTVFNFIVGSEVYCEFPRPATGFSTADSWQPGFTFLKNLSTQKFYHARVVSVAAGTAKVALRAWIPGSADNVESAPFAWAAGESQRIGITITDDSPLTMDVWREPAGGGTRTTLFTYTPVNNFFGVAGHTAAGIYLSSTGVAGELWNNFKIIDTTQVLDASTDWTLPYSVAVDGSEGTVQVVLEDGTVLTSTRPTPTTVQVLGDYSSTEVAIGLRYDFEAELSKIYLRNADYTGIPRADTRKRLQLQRLRFLHDATLKYDVTVQGSERSEVTYPYSVSAETDGSHRAPILSNNELVTISIKNPYPVPSWITGFEWEGIFKARTGLR